jgi:hypothetical protein
MSNIPEPIVEYTVVERLSLEDLVAGVQQLLDSADPWTIVGGHNSAVLPDGYVVWSQTLVRGFDN